MVTAFQKEILVVAVLFVFGLGYNGLVARLERAGHDRGYTAFLVVGGVGVTLAGAVPLVGLLPVLMMLACFAASGLPMVVGSWARYTRARNEEEHAVIEIAREMMDHAEATNGRLPVETGDRAGRQRK